MTLGNAAILLAVSIFGIILSCRYLRDRKALFAVLVVMLSLVAVLLLGYIAMTLLFVKAID